MMIRVASGAAPVKFSPGTIFPAAIPASAVPWPLVSLDGTMANGSSEASARSISFFRNNLPYGTSVSAISCPGKLSASPFSASDNNQNDQNPTTNPDDNQQPENPTENPSDNTNQNPAENPGDNTNQTPTENPDEDTNQNRTEADTQGNPADTAVNATEGVQ